MWAIDAEIYDARLSTVRLEQSQQPGLKDRDQVILFEREEDEVFFASTAYIDGASTTPIANEKFHFKAELVRFTELTPRRKLSDFTYSLEKVYRYLEPWVHFKRNYVSLTTSDFNTLVDARIFWARTAFGTYLNGLPDAAVADFVRYVSMVEPRLLVDQQTFSALWTQLRDFVAGEYLGAYQLTNAISEMIEKLSVTGVSIDFNEIRVGHEENKIGDFLAGQHRRLLDFAVSILPTRTSDGVTEDLFETLGERIRSNSATEASFEYLFRGTRWPTRVIPR